jgi:hypothetical protein
MSSARGLPSLGGSGPQLSVFGPPKKLVGLGFLLVLLASLLRDWCGSPPTAEAPLASSDEANP